MTNPRPNSSERPNPREGQRKLLADLETPDDLASVIPGLTEAQARAIFENRKEVGTLWDLLRLPDAPLTESQVAALRDAGYVAIPEAPEVTEAPEPEIEEESKIKLALKTIIKPISWKDKSKFGYGVGVAAGILSKGSWFVAGPILEFGLGAATYLGNLAYDKIAKYQIEKAQGLEERIRREEKYKRAGGFIRGVAAGYSATSLANMAGSAVAPGLMAKLYASKPFIQATEFATKKWAAFETLVKGDGLASNPIAEWWAKAFDTITNAVRGMNVEVNTSRDSILKEAGKVVEAAGIKLGELGTYLSAP